MQRPSPLFCAGWWPFILVPFLMTLIVLFFSWQKIERKVAINTQQLLDHEYSWIKVENFNRGRDILLTGTAPNQLAAEQAMAVASSAPGVRVAQFVGELAPVLNPALISIVFEGGNIVFSGNVDNNTSRKSIIDSARVQFKQRPVVDKLETNNDTASLQDISQLLAVASQLEDGAKVSIEGDKLNVQANVKNNNQINSIGTRFARAFDGTFENNLVVTAHQQCLNKLSGLLAENMIYFDSGTTTIQARSSAVMETIFETITGCPGIELQVDGHTDNTGSSARNLVLSRERAQSVLDQLVARGLEADRFTANGYGAERPIQSNDTAEGRSANRRIEFKLK